MAMGQLTIRIASFFEKGSIFIVAYREGLMDAKLGGDLFIYRKIVYIVLGKEYL